MGEARPPKAHDESRREHAVQTSNKLTVTIALGLSFAISGCDSGPSPTAECANIDSAAADYTEVAASCQAESKEMGWEPVCGNGYIDEGESCDSSFIPYACSDIPRFGEFAGGETGCSDTCTLDVSACAANVTYPAGPYGASPGMPVENMKFVPANQAARDLAKSDEVFDMTALYTNGPSHDGDIIGVLLFQTTGWCPYCGDEAALLEGMYNDYRDRGFLVIGVVAEDRSGEPATIDYANGYGASYGWSFPIVTGQIPSAYDPSGGMPLNLLLTTKGMEKYDAYNGAKPEFYLNADITRLMNAAESSL